MDDNIYNKAGKTKRKINMLSAKNLFLLLLITLTIYAGIGTYSFAIDVMAKVAARSAGI